MCVAVLSIILCVVDLATTGQLAKLPSRVMRVRKSGRALWIHKSCRKSDQGRIHTGLVKAWNVFFCSGHSPEIHSSWEQRHCGHLTFPRNITFFTPRKSICNLLCMVDQVDFFS